MTVEPGLCRSCRWMRIVESGRGSRFYLCGRSRFDDRFARYPRLPVLRCVGYEPRLAPTGEPGPDSTEVT
jgi:hypothetical protein